MPHSPEPKSGPPAAGQALDLSRVYLMGEKTGRLGELLDQHSAITLTPALPPGDENQRVRSATCLVYSDADPRSPQMAAAAAAGIPAVSRAQALDALMSGRRWTGVIGSHGKSLAAAMLAHIMAAQPGLDPTWFVDAPLREGPSTRFGMGPAAVVELDESDRSFLQARPSVALILNATDEHPETYPQQGDLTAVLLSWAMSLGPQANLVVCGDDGGTMMLLDKLSRLPNTPAMSTYGFSPFASTRILAIDETFDGFRTVVDIQHGDTRISLEINQPGWPAARAAVAAVAAAAHYGITPEASAAALKTFKGVPRRMEHLGSVGGVKVFDSCAAHPVEIAADLETAREWTEDGRLLVVFQPTGAKRLSVFHSEMGSALRKSDLILLLPLHDERPGEHAGTNGELVSSDLLVDRLSRGRAAMSRASSPAEAAGIVSALARPGDTVVAVGGGDVAKVGPLLIKALQAASA